MTQPLDLSVTVDGVPSAGLLRPAIEAAMAGRSWPDGPEAVIARAVAAKVAQTAGTQPCAGAGGPPC